MAFEDITKQLKAADERLAYAKELAAKGDLNKAEKIMRANLSAIVDFYGPNSLKTCNLLVDLAEINYSQEKYPEVVTILQQVLVTTDSDPIYSNEELLSIKFKFAKALQHSGNFQDASKAYQALLAESERFLGPSSRFTRTIAESLNKLARHHRNRLEKMEAVEEQVSQFDTGKNLIIKADKPDKQSDKLRSFNAQSDFQKFKALEPAPKRYLGPAVSLIAATVLCVGLFLSGVLNDQSFISMGGSSVNKDNNSAVATAALEHTSNNLASGTYASTDGQKVLQVNDQGNAKLIANNQQSQVKLVKNGSELYINSGSEQKVFRIVRHGVVDNQGSILYKAGVPELKTAATVRTLAANLNNYYRSHGKYPGSQSQLNSMRDGSMYKHPLHESYTFPRLMSVIERRSYNEMTLSDYNFANQFTSQLVSDNQATGEPCGIEIYVCPLSDRGETVVIRAFDSNGKLLPSSHQGRAYSLILSQGFTRS